MKNNKTKLIIIVLTVFVVTASIVYGNTALTVSEYVVENEKIPKSFSGYRIVQISDLHNAEFGKENIRLVNTVKSAKPDIIVITGDLIDSRRTDIEKAVIFVKQVVAIAPVYYVSGNHESRVAEYSVLKELLNTTGVTVLENETVIIESEGERILLAGIDDPDFTDEYAYEAIISETLKKQSDSDLYTVLLAHRPEYMKSYVKNAADLVFSGHAHGGQFRLPFTGGVFAPGQGFFPEYDSGVYSENGTTMIVSRGIGNSIIPIRINNKPEITVVQLEH